MSTNLNDSPAYRWRLPLTVLALLGGWCGALFSQPAVPEHSLLDHVLDGLAWALLAAGIGIRAWSSREISGRKKVTVVKTGPYALCRNPLYWGTFLIAVSQLFFLRSLVFSLSMVVPIVVYVLGVVPAEERALAATLGEDYREYCRETPRWLPRWNSRVLVLSPLENSGPYRRELIGLGCWLLLPAAAELICYLRELPGWPHILL